MLATTRLLFHLGAMFSRMQFSQMCAGQSKRLVLLLLETSTRLYALRIVRWGSERTTKELLYLSQGSSASDYLNDKNSDGFI